MERKLNDDIRERARAQRDRREGYCLEKFGMVEPPVSAPCRQCGQPAGDHVLPKFDCPGNVGGTRRRPLGDP